MFEEINNWLKRECFHLRNEVDPLRTILLTTDFELPLYYALCNVMERSANEIAEGLSGLSTDGIKFPVAQPRAASRLTFDTILVCAYNAIPLDTREGSFFKNIGLGWESVFEETLCMSQIRKYINYVHDRYYPVARDPSGRLHAWNPMFCKWESVETDERVFWMRRFSLVSRKFAYFKGFRKLSDPIYWLLLHDRNWLKHQMKASLRRNGKGVTIGNVWPGDREEFRRLYGRNVPEYYFFGEAPKPILDMFEKINESLRFECPHMREEVHPLRTILRTAGNFERPLFYALCNVMCERVPSDIALELSGLCPDGPDLRCFLGSPPPVSASRLGFETLYHIAYLAVPPEENGELIDRLGRDWNLGPGTTMKHMRRCVEVVQERFYPVARGLSCFQAWSPTRLRWERVNTKKTEGDFWRCRLDEVWATVRKIEGFRSVPQGIQSGFLGKRGLREKLVEVRLRNRSMPVVGNTRPEDPERFRELFGREVPEYYFFRDDCSPSYWDYQSLSQICKEINNKYWWLRLMGC